MDAVTKQAGSTRISSLVAATVASGTVAGLVVLGTVTGVLPSRGAALRSDLPSRLETQPAPPSNCALCGTIESIRTMEIYEEPGNTPLDARNGDAAGGGPGGAIAGGATSMLDTLMSAVRGDSESNVRKRHVYRVTLRMDDGSFRAISLSSPPAFAVGDKVRVVEGRLVRS